MAIKDAAVLGILFSPAYFTGNVAETLEVYQEVCLLRATKVQSASAKAAYNINERIGFSSNTNIPNYTVEDDEKKLAIEEMNAYNMYKDIEEVPVKRQRQPFSQKFIRGLPIGLRLSNGITVGQ